MIFPRITPLLFAALGCALNSAEGLISSMPKGVGQAIIGRKDARFVFPREVDSLFRWDLPEPRLAPTVPEFNWTVLWEAPGGPRNGANRANSDYLLARRGTTRGHTSADA